MGLKRSLNCFTCPECGSLRISTWRVLSSLRHNVKRRVRECLKCGHRYNTVELVETDKISYEPKVEV